MGERQAPTTTDDLLEAPIEPGNLAIDIQADEWYAVLGVPDTRAGDYHLEGELGTVAEWCGVDAETRVIVAASIDEANEKPLHVESVDDLAAAVERGRLMVRALPASRVVPALDEFVAARRAGEWDGLAEYIERQQEVCK